MMRMSTSLFCLCLLCLTGHAAAGGSQYTRSVIRGWDPSETVTQFIDRAVRPTPLFNRRCKEIVKSLTQLLNSRKSPFKIKAIMKGGSLGKATAVRRKSDIDLVIVMNGFDSMEDLWQNMSPTLTSLKAYIHQEASWASNLMFKDQTPFSLQFYMKQQEGDYEHEVDLLPALDITRSKSKEDMRVVYEAMGRLTAKERGVYSASLAPLQVSFISQLPAKVKDTIMLVKYWAKDEDVPVKSYFLELLVVYQWRREKTNNARSFDHTDCFKKILKLLVDCKNIAIAFDDNYDISDYRTQTELKKPYLLDPANPFRNVAPTSGECAAVMRKSAATQERFPGETFRDEL